MSTSAPSLKYDMTTADNAANIMNGIHAAIVTTAGWTQTTDTGQAITQAGGLTVSITNISRTTTVVTLTYASQGSYPFIVGQTITVATSGTFSPTASGTFVITGVTATTLTYTTSSGTIASVADTGTIKLFMAAGGSINRIYKASDSLASMCPIFLKIRLVRSATGNVPNVGVQFGQGSDGAGNLTGLTTVEAISTNTGTAQGATTYVCHLAGGTSWLAVELWIASSQTATFFAVERSRDASGAETAEYFSIMTGVDGSNVNLQTFYATGAGTLAEIHMPIFFPLHSAFNNNIWTWPWFPIIGRVGNPHIGAIVPAALVTTLSTVTLAFYGTNHTLLCIGGPTAPGPISALANSNDAAWLMRWE